MLSTIKTCFGLYYDNFKNIIKSDIVYDVDNMSVEEIDAQVDIIYMKYITMSSFSISLTSIQVVAYTHMKNVISSYKVSMNVPVSGNHVANLSPEQKKAGWFS